MSARPPKLPPLPRYQSLEWIDHRCYWQGITHATLSEAQAAPLMKQTNTIGLVRRLRDGKIVYRNKAAKEAGL